MSDINYKIHDFQSIYGLARVISNIFYEWRDFDVQIYNRSLKCLSDMYVIIHDLSVQMENIPDTELKLKEDLYQSRLKSICEVAENE